MLALDDASYEEGQMSYKWSVYNYGAKIER